jgi:hypothetical protein
LRVANIKNLKPIKTLSNDEAKKRGSAGGKKSGEVRREKKLLSVMYADLLAKGFEVDGERLSLDQVASAIMARRDSASVSMLKEIREATEGSKTNLVVEDGGPVAISLIKRVIVDQGT